MQLFNQATQYYFLGCAQLSIYGQPQRLVIVVVYSCFNEITVVQGSFLEYASLCNDQQTCPLDIRDHLTIM